MLGTFSAAQFIKPYLTHLVRTGSETTLTVQGEPLTPSVALAALNEAIDRVHSDVLVTGRIDGARHPASYGLFHNKPGLVDGNGYGFLLNPLGVAVNGFPTSQATQPSQHLRLHNVHIDRLHGFINEVVALNSGGGATIDPVGAVWQLFNIHPDTGVPLTVTELSGEARYSGNVLANAQALVAKAIHAGDFNNAHLSTRRANITPAMLAWVEARPGAETLAAAIPEQNRYLCNGDSMFHVNKGMVGFKLDGAQRGLLTQTSVRNVRNFGAPGSDLCGDYRNGKSHQLATLPGYGGARIRGYSLAGSKAWALLNASARNLLSTSGDVFGVDALTDSRQLWLANTRLTRLTAGDASAAGVNAPNLPPEAAGMKIGADTQSIVSINLCVRKLTGVAGAQAVDDKSGSALRSATLQRLTRAPGRATLNPEGNGRRSMAQLIYSEAELYTDHEYASPHLIGEQRLHGGFDADGHYQPPRAKGRGEAMAAWTERLQAAGGDLFEADASLLLRGVRLPNAEQQKLLLAAGLATPFWNSLTITGKIEGRGRMLAEMAFPDLGELIVEDISEMAIGHLSKGLLVIHGIDEGGEPERGIGGHDLMWFAARDLVFNREQFSDVEPPASISRPEAGKRWMPDLPPAYEGMLSFLMNLLMIEFRAEIGFANTQAIFRDPELFSDRRMAAEQAAELIERIRLDEEIHVESLRLYLGELRELHARGEDGCIVALRPLIDDFWDGLVRWATIDQPELAAQSAYEALRPTVLEHGGNSLLDAFKAAADLPLD